MRARLAEMSNPKRTHSFRRRGSHLAPGDDHLALELVLVVFFWEDFMCSNIAALELSAAFWNSAVRCTSVSRMKTR